IAQHANLILAGPTSGASAVAPTFRALVSGDIPNNAANTSGTAANLSGTPALPNGTTATTQTAGDNTTDIATDAFVNAAVSAVQPMTTLGDIIYENATPTPARLAGNVTAAREFLLSVGSGSVAAAPSWAALVSGDIPNNAANTSGTAANL